MNLSGALSGGGTVEVATNALMLNNVTADAIGAVTMAGGSVTKGTGTFTAGTLSGYGTYTGRLTGTTSVTASGGTLSIGNASVTDALTLPGTVTVENGAALTLNQLNVVSLGATTTLEGGAMSSGSGFQLAVGRSVVGDGTINNTFYNAGTVSGNTRTITFSGTVRGAGDLLGTIGLSGTLQVAYQQSGASDFGVVDVGTLNLASGSAITLRIKTDDTVGTTYSQLHGTALNTNGFGTLTIVLDAADTTTFTTEADSQRWQGFHILNFTNINGTFQQVVTPTLPQSLTDQGFVWDTSKLYSNGLLLLVPEPSTYATVAGIMILAYTIWRRRS